MTLLLARNSAVIQSDHYLNSPLDLLLSYTHNPLSLTGTKGDTFSIFIIHTPLYVEPFSWLPLLKTS